MTKRFVFPLLVLGLFLLPAEAFWPFSDPEPPVQEDVLVSTLIGQPYQFAPEDFSPVGNTADAYEIGPLPDAEIGVLQIGAMLVEEGSSVARDALSGLTWYPLDDSVREISFTVTPVSDGVFGAPAAVTIQFLTHENLPPETRDSTVTTYRSSPTSGTLNAADPEGDSLRYFLLTPPEQGEVSLSGDGSFTYTPGKKAGRFSFVWLARDSFGNRSLPATVTVTVEREEAAVTYADLADADGALCYAASRLAQEGIYTGPLLDGQYCFQPEQALTRSEFLVLTLRAAGIAPLTADAVTGFSDDAQIPAWAKPYAAAAWQAGLICGRPNGDGTAAFCPNEWITPAEAAVLLNRVLPLSDVTVQVFAPACADSWAGQAIANLCFAGLFTQEQALEPALSRGSAALLLCAVLE